MGAAPEKKERGGPGAGWREKTRSCLLGASQPHQKGEEVTAAKINSSDTATSAEERLRGAVRTFRER